MNFLRMIKYCILLALFSALVSEVTAMRKQGVAVRGQLLCGSRPANETRVRIVDIDTGLWGKLRQMIKSKYRDSSTCLLREKLFGKLTAAL